MPSRWTSARRESTTSWSTSRRRSAPGAANAARLLAAAVGHCLGASLLFCLRRSRIPVKQLRVTVAGTLVRNERGRLRIGEIRVSLAPDITPEDRDRIGRCLDVFEDYCIVTESVRQGIPVTVAAEPAVAAVAAGV